MLQFPLSLWCNLRASCGWYVYTHMDIHTHPCTSMCMNEYTYKPIDMCMYRCVFTHLCTHGLVMKSCLSLVTPWTIGHQAPLSIGFSRQEYWSGLPFPSLGHPPDLGIEHRSPALQADSFPSMPPGKPSLPISIYYCEKKRKPVSKPKFGL